MSALPKPEPVLFADVEEVDGQQIIRLPAQLHLETKQLQVSRSGNGLSLQPVPRRLSEAELAQWMADMQAFQEELGDFFPEGRNQPPMPEPRVYFPEDEER